MQKLGKIIILFNLFFFLRNAKTSNFNRYIGKFFKKEFFFVKDFNKTYRNVFLFKKGNWFLLNNNLFLFKTYFRKKHIYFCVRLKKRSIIISIYYKTYLLLNIFQSFAKKIRNRKKIQKLYKRDNIEYGARKPWIRLSRMQYMRKRYRIISGVKIKVKIVNFAIKVLLKLVLFLSINKINICFFKNSIKTCNKKIRKLYQKKRDKILKIKVFKKLKKLFFLKILKVKKRRSKIRG